MCNSHGHPDYYTSSASPKEMSSRKTYEPTKVEHIANMITHAIWILPSLLGFYNMLQLSDSLKKFLVISLYGVCLVSLFSVSTIFHFVAYVKQKNCLLKSMFHLGDRAAIYLFIAASYTPWLILRDFHSNAVSFVVVAIWLAAFLGIVYQCRFHERFKWLEIIFYLSLGVLPAFVTIDIKDSSGLFDVAYGGAIYILGVFFFKADGILPCAHAVWHCFVTAGALVHYQAIYRYLLI